MLQSNLPDRLTTSTNEASRHRPCSAPLKGLSVYVDGIRANQPLGDVVSWDLIPDYRWKSAMVLSII